MPDIWRIIVLGAIAIAWVVDEAFGGGHKGPRR